MSELTAAIVRRSMINCSQGDSKRMTIPDEILDADLEVDAFVAWHDPKMAHRAYLVAHSEGAVTGVLLRRAAAPPRRRTAVCALCRTTRVHGDVSLYTAPRAGSAGRQGNSVGTYLCEDLDCPEMVRLETVSASVIPELGVPLEERVEGLTRRLEGFLTAVRRPE